MNAYDLIPLTSLEKAMLPIAEASGLPSPLYNDPDMFVHERDLLLGKTWAGVGFAGDIPQLGYVKPVFLWGHHWLLSVTMTILSAYSITSVAIAVCY